MNTYAMNILEFNKIKESLKQYALSEKARSRIEGLTPSTTPEVVRSWMLETTEARRILEINRSIPLSSLENISEVTEKLGRGIVLNPEELTSVKSLLECVRRLRKFMSAMMTSAPGVAAYALSMYELRDLFEEIDRCIANGGVDDRATPELGKVRKQILIADERIRQKLSSILSSSTYAPMLQEAVISLRNGRYVIPIKKEYRKNFEGNVLDTSSSGSTLFMEPAGIARLQQEVNELRFEEEREVYRVLGTLTNLVESYSREISLNVEAMVHYDFVFSKAKYSQSLDCRPVSVNSERRMLIRQGRHPLLGRSAVPLDFYIGTDYRALVITGPNTGGKTVALKTIGLICLMAQAGLHVPVAEGSETTLFADILADIGDGQSIEQSLSTFSAHVRNIAAIVQCADPDTLVIMDELGAGTDPGEGTGFAIAVLETVFARGATLIATTHFSEIKDFAARTPGFKNGCMEFDIHTLKPLYRLHIGRSGESNAFIIALKLGMPRELIERAHEITYGERKAYVNHPLLQVDTVVNEPVIESHTLSIQEIKSSKETRKHVERQEKISAHNYNVGDCVYISTMKRSGIVCEPENSRGEVVVMVMKKKLKVNKKRLSLHIEGKELYPEEYDLDIVLESKENRKKRHLMGKRHVEGLAIEIPDDPKS